jgi:hypothetical protein
LPRQRRYLLLAGFVALVLTSCRVDGRVELTMVEDGSGVVEVTVTLDQEAAAQVPDLENDLRVDDLEATGWDITGPTETEDGGLEMVASRDFATPRQAQQILRQVGGRGGILRELSIQRDHSFGQTEWSFAGVLDLSEGLAAFSDADLTEVLGGEPVGRDPAQLEEEFGAPVSELFTMTVEARLPGDEPADSWSAGLGDQPVEMSLESSERDTTVLGLALAAAVGVVLLLLLLLVRAIRRRRRRREEA